MRIAASFTAALGLAVLAQAPLTAQQPDTAFVGSWMGQAPLTAPWIAQRVLVIRLDIREDGRVTGRIGDAQMIDGRIFPESQLARAMHQGGRYVIEARLEGAIVRAERVQRDRVRLSVDRAGQTLTGELRTNGSYEGGASELMLTVKSFVLQRVDRAVSRRTTWAPMPSR